MWLANETRLDIAKAMRAVARYTNSPREVHWMTAVGILECVFPVSDLSHPTIEVALFAPKRAWPTELLM